MIRIRFHGRGGHGAKTASRIVGTAAFLGGYQAQDSPVYGAERRGAAVVAYARIDSQPILERGVIEQPDLIILADETLLEAPDAGVLARQDSASAIFINTGDADALVQKYEIKAPVAALDLTTLALECVGSASALSAGVAAAAARLSGMVHREQLIQAVHEEFAHLHLPDDLIERNVRLAEQVFAALTPAALRDAAPRRQTAMAKVRFDPPLVSSPSVLNVGNAVARQTGSWRVERPVVDAEACTRCGLCLVQCPDGAITLDEQGLPVFDYAHCKGCMICGRICPLHAIASEQETRAW